MSTNCLDTSAAIENRKGTAFSSVPSLHLKKKLTTRGKAR
jgi:hypothetical protein